MDVCLHQKNDSKWISMPARPYEQNGEKQWAQVIEFDSPESRKTFQRAAIRAVETYQFAKNANPEAQEEPRW